MKTVSKIALLTLSATTMVVSIASAQPYPAYKTLDDLTAAQVTQIKQLGHISSNDSIDPIYDAKLERILTPEQNMKHLSLKYGQKNTLNTADFNIKMDSK